ncbi:MAG: DNA methyltransferase [Candidatus Sulfotelmatobacter sp.]
MTKWYRNSLYTIHNADSFVWLRGQRANSFHAVVTDPPFGIVEYTARELHKRRNGNGGIWRLPNARDGADRQQMPRFTVLDGHDRMGVLAFHLRLAPELFRVLVPGAHVMLASHCLISHLAAQAFCMAGFEARGQIVRVVKTLRGGDRPKFGEKDYPEVSVIPRSCFEPWLLFRKPCEGRVAQNLKRFGTGALRRPSESMPFSDLLVVPPARPRERALANHPSLKPQTLMRSLVRAALPLGKGVLLDPFMGAGSAIAAAANLGLKSVGVELDPKYFTMARSAIPKLAEFDSAHQNQSAA